MLALADMIRRMSQVREELARREDNITREARHVAQLKGELSALSRNVQDGMRRLDVHPEQWGNAGGEGRLLSFLSCLVSPTPASHRADG